MPVNLYVGLRKKEFILLFTCRNAGSTAATNIVVWPVSQVLLPKLPLDYSIYLTIFQHGRPSSSYFWPRSWRSHHLFPRRFQIDVATSRLRGLLENITFPLDIFAFIQKGEWRTVLNSSERLRKSNERINLRTKRNQSWIRTSTTKGSAMH